MGSIPDEVIRFFNLPNQSSLTMALWSTQPLTEMSTRNISGGKGRPAHKANSLMTIYELTEKCRTFEVSQHCGPPQPVTGIDLSLHLPCYFIYSTLPNLDLLIKPWKKISVVLMCCGWISFHKTAYLL
jgi:hypothetical protein